MLQVLKMITRKEKLRKIATLGGPEVQERGQFRSYIIRGSVLMNRERAGVLGSKAFFAKVDLIAS